MRKIITIILTIIMIFSNLSFASCPSCEIRNKQNKKVEAERLDKIDKLPMKLVKIDLDKSDIEYIKYREQIFVPIQDILEKLDVKYKENEKNILIYPEHYQSTYVKDKKGDKKNITEVKIDKIKRTITFYDKGKNKVNMTRTVDKIIKKKDKLFFTLYDIQQSLLTMPVYQSKRNENLLMITYFNYDKFYLETSMGIKFIQVATFSVPPTRPSPISGNTSSPGPSPSSGPSPSPSSSSSPSLEPKGEIIYTPDGPESVQPYEHPYIPDYIPIYYPAPPKMEKKVCGEV